MLFKVEDVNGRSTHCGVLEFLAEEGVVYMPHWVSALPSLSSPFHARELPGNKFAADMCPALMQPLTNAKCEARDS
eukprot:1157693-Pelagomonas_calceolata.AAC.4